LIPIDVWVGFFDGASLDEVWKIALFYVPFTFISAGIPSLAADYFKIEMQDGWGIMYN